MLTTEHGIFTNNEITGQTAEEVYQGWLENRGKPLAPDDLELLKVSDTFLLMELMNTQTELLQEQKINAALYLELVSKGVI